MELSEEQRKEKRLFRLFMTQYYGQKVGRAEVFGVILKHHIDVFNTTDYLGLRDIDFITDEEATICANLIFEDQNADPSNPDKELVDMMKESYLNCRDIYLINIGCGDYLRQQGYLIPFLTFSIEDILKKGWVKLETKS